MTAVTPLVIWLAASPETPATPSPLMGQCEAEAGNQPPLRGGDQKVSAPKRVRYVAPVYPTDTVGRKGGGMWAGEALIDTTGVVSRVWTLRTPSFKPAWPEFSEAIVRAVRQWKYSPTVIDGVARPICMVVTVNINWR